MSTEPDTPQDPSAETPAEAPANPTPSPAAQSTGPVGEKKMISGIFAILLGSFGVHKFYLGYTTEGVIQLLLSFACGLGGIIGIIEGIIYLTKSDEEFDKLYIHGRKGWF